MRYGLGNRQAVGALQSDCEELKSANTSALALKAPCFNRTVRN